ncbi:UbiX family flavin prenyltransferase [uncultured Paenalcaligenes sp.]|uniref:UbiX family flavin prenyltransferase n=2 Tax=Paenalcaligenes TaxID=1100891 RepID=UPI00260DA423|nr:UbiX family flavin prenyltransferase [uncultured Paenalcaligenes sp.]
MLWMPNPKKRIIVAMTGATGALYAVRTLKMLRTQKEIETHLIVSPAGILNLQHELNLQRSDLSDLADVVHSFKDVGASVASGSFKTHGMIIVPCSMRTLAAVAHGLADNLITRAADVVLKERRRLVMVVRETPFNLAHLRNMTAVTEMGAVVFPPLPAFYFQPQTITELVDHSVVRILEHAGVDIDGPTWQGL